MTEQTNMKLFCCRCDKWIWAARPGLPEGWEADDAGRPVCGACKERGQLLLPKCPDCGEHHSEKFECLQGTAKRLAAEEQECDGCDYVHEPPMCEGHNEDDRYAVREYVLDEAKRLVCGDRNASYGDPRQDFQRTAGVMTALLGHKLKPGEVISAADVARLLIAVKLSRSVHQRKLDHAIDGAGYFSCLAHCEFDAEDLPK